MATRLPLGHDSHSMVAVTFVFTQGQFWPSSIVVACFCLCVRVCINHLLVHMITWDPFKLRSPNLNQRCKTPRLRSLLFRGTINFDLQCQILTLKVKFYPILSLMFGRTKTHHPFKLESPNLDQMCKTPWLSSLLFVFSYGGRGSNT